LRRILEAEVRSRAASARRQSTGLEEERFGLTLDRGLGKLSKLLADREEISGADAFSLYDTHGLPVELTIDLVRQRGGKLSQTFAEEYEARMAEHKERSRTAAEGLFKGGPRRPFA
jgi:alanyl-tRNA synthetase